MITALTLSGIFAFYYVIMESGSHWMPLMGDTGWASLYMTVFYVLLLMLLFGLVVYVYMWILNLWKRMSGKRQE